MTQEEAKQIILELLPYVWRESQFLTPIPSYNLPASTVFDALRRHSEPPITEEEFNRAADELDGLRAAGKTTGPPS